MTQESHEILTMRGMAWERAKGELLSYLATFWPCYNHAGEKVDNGFQEANSRIEKFIEEFEENCR